MVIFCADSSTATHRRVVARSSDQKISNPYRAL